MRVAGIRLPDGTARWVDAGARHVAPLDMVLIDIGGREEEGTVFVAPEQLAAGAPPVEGTLLQMRPRQTPDLGCSDLPGADLPPLGSRLRIADVEGIVMAVDAVKRTVTVATIEGQEVVTSFPAPHRDRQ